MKYKLINYCEFDKYAKKAYSLIHNESEDKNLGDITQVNEKEIADFNMMVGGSPCQDFSVAGKGEGAVWTCKDCKDDEGNDYQYNPLEVHYTKRDKCPKCNSTNIEKTRSSLVVEWLRILHEKKPNLAMYENVKNLVGKKHKHFFDLFIAELHEYGYNTYWKVLNAKDYGIPQNRERVYLIIIKKELDNGKFKFPEGFDNGIRLKDILLKEVDEKYYISQDKVDKLIKDLKDKNKINNSNNEINVVGNVGNTGHHGLDVYSETGITPTLKARDYKDPIRIFQIGNIVETGNFENPQRGRIYSPDGIYPALNTCGGGGLEPKILENTNKQGLKVIEESPSPELVGGVGEINFGKQYRQGNRIYSSDKTAMCLLSQPVENTGGYSYLYEINYRIRKLIPLECFKLMGFSEKDYYILENNKISNSQCYKLAGNSIVVDVLYYILLEVYKVMPYLLEDIKLSSFFSGIGAFEKAIIRLQNKINEKTN